MAARQLYGNPVLVDQIISKLTPSEKLDDESITYKDDQANESWLKYEVDSMYIGGRMTNLVRLPEPTTYELIDIIFSSEHDDEVVAASLRLRDNELYREREFREELLNKITGMNVKKLTTEQKARLKKIIVLTELDHGENRREVLGRNVKDIKADSDFFMTIADKTDKILKILKTLK